MGEGIDIFGVSGIDIFSSIRSISETFKDDVALQMGTGGTTKLLYETADANANELIIVFPEGGATDVPVLVVGDASIDNVDLGVFNGQTEPRIVVYNDAADAYIAFDAGDDAVAQSKGVYFKAAADEDIELINLSVTGTPRVYWDESEDQVRSTKGWVFDAACDVQGTWVATATWTLPAVTLSGTVDANANSLDNVSSITDDTVSPASSGFIRVGHGTFPLLGMNNAGSSTRELISWGQGGTDVLRLCGDNDALAFFGGAGQVRQATIANADGTLADITTKFNTLLADLEGFGFLAAA